MQLIESIWISVPSFVPSLVPVQVRRLHYNTSHATLSASKQLSKRGKIITILVVAQVTSSFQSNSDNLYKPMKVPYLNLPLV